MKKEVFMIACYLRTSTDKQETRAQKSAITKWIKEKKYPDAEILWYVDDAQTGATLDRPAFKKLMQDVKEKTINRLILFELSRLSRSFLSLLKVMEELTEHKVIVETPSEGVIQFDGSMQQFLVAARALNADQERQKIRERTKAGLEAAKERGVKLGAPTGNQNRKGKKKEHDLEFLERLQRLSKKLSCREIAKEVGVCHGTVARLLKQYQLNESEGGK